jgi:O-6-methylguanine DNA methyltransferase
VTIVRQSGPPRGVRWDVVRVPLGRLVVGLNPAGQICRSSFAIGRTPAAILGEWKRAWPGTRFERARLRGDLRRKAVAVAGSAFQIAVWKAVAAIPAGTVATYGEIASRLGRPRAFRAVGTACANNVVSYFIPCFRMIRADGKAGFNRQHELLLAEEALHSTGRRARSLERSPSSPDPRKLAPR